MADCRPRRERRQVVVDRTAMIALRGSARPPRLGERAQERERVEVDAGHARGWRRRSPRGSGRPSRGRRSRAGPSGSGRPRRRARRARGSRARPRRAGWRGSRARGSRRRSRAAVVVDAGDLDHADADAGVREAEPDALPRQRCSRRLVERGASPAGSRTSPPFTIPAASGSLCERTSFLPPLLTTWAAVSCAALDLQADDLRRHLRGALGRRPLPCGGFAFAPPWEKRSESLISFFRSMCYTSASRVRRHLERPELRVTPRSSRRRAPRACSSARARPRG